MNWFSEVIREPERINLLMAPSLNEIFYYYTVTLLGLLFPLSYSILARLSNADYLLTFTSDPSPPNSSLLALFLHSKPPFLHSLVFVVTVAVLIQCLTGHDTGLQDGTRESEIFKPRISTAWVLLGTFQICVALGCVGIIASGIGPVDYPVLENGMFTVLSRTVFFIGLHEAMIHWSKAIVRPVVDDTIFGAPRKEGWTERVTMGACFGVLWWRNLRDDIGSLVLLLELKREAMVRLGLIDILGWLLYYLIVAIGLVRLINWLIWFGKVLLCKVSEKNVSYHMNDDKV